MKTSNRDTQSAISIGTDGLRLRHTSRLWYRQNPLPLQTLSPEDDLTLGNPITTVQVARSETTSQKMTDQLVRESSPNTRGLEEIRAILDKAESQPSPASGNLDTTKALTEWRDAPMHAPVILLSASHILDARNPGPILGPGRHYRILSVNDGVVALQVATLDGQVGTGYCNAIDIICFEPDIASYRRERQTGKLGTARLGLNKISQRISGVTATLIG